MLQVLPASLLAYAGWANVNVLSHDDKLAGLFTGLRQKQRQDSDLIELVFPTIFAPLASRLTCASPLYLWPHILGSFFVRGTMLY